MRFSELFAENLLVRWLTGRTGGYDLAVTMTGVKLGERVLLAGCGDARLLGALGAKSGLTGHICGVDTDREAAGRAERRAERDGVLVEVFALQSFASVPGDDGTFDLAVADVRGSLADPAGLDGALHEFFRLLRPGGRAMIVGRADSAPAAMTAALQRHGFRGPRVLAERDRWWFVEALKGR